MTDDKLVLVHIPPLVAILFNQEKAKGSPLVEEEVLAIRDGAVCMAMSREAAAQMAAKRGYDDVMPENVWEDWKVVRPSLGL